MLKESLLGLIINTKAECLMKRMREFCRPACTMLSLRSSAAFDLKLVLLYARSYNNTTVTTNWGNKLY